MTFGRAIAICSNLNNPREREKFMDDEILLAIQTVLNHEGHDVIKSALVNMCEYLLEKTEEAK